VRADKLIDIPPGGWNFYARKGDEYVSDWGDYARIAEIDRVAPGFKRFVMELRAAGRVSLDRLVAELAPGEFLSLYFPANSTSPAFVLPVPRGVTSLPAPAGRSFAPIVIRDRRPVRIGAFQAASRDRPLIVEPFANDDRVVDVVTWATRISEGAVLQLSTGNGRVFQTGRQTTRPLQLVLFKDVPVGRITASLVTRNGRVTDAVTMEPVVGARVLITPRALGADDEEGVVLSFDPDLIAAARMSAENPCGTEAPQAGSLAFLKCPNLTQDSLPERSRCELVVSHVLRTSSLSDKVTVPTPPVGRYLIELTLPGSSPLRDVINIPEDRQLHLSPLRLQGRVTQNSSPVNARIVVGKVSAVTGIMGEFLLLLPEKFSPAKDATRATVIECVTDRRHDVILDKPLSELSILDIQLGKKLKVTAVDSSGRPISNARIGIEQTSPEKRRRYIQGPRTATDGTAVIENVVASSPVTICATHEEFERACVDDVTIGARESIELVLNGRRLRKGHITGFPAIESGRIWFLGSDARVVGAASVKQDGSFTVEHSTPHAYVVIASRNLPLFAIPTSELDIPVELREVGAVQVFLAPASKLASAVLGLTIGGLGVPPSILEYHQGMRSSRVVVLRDGDVLIKDIALTAPVTVIRGWDDDAGPPGGIGEQAMFRIEYRSLFPERPFSRNGVIVFE
jgi:hypothetical protein